MLPQKNSNSQQDLDSSQSESPVSALETLTPDSNTGLKSQNINQLTDNPGLGFDWKLWQPKYAPWIDYLQGTGYSTLAKFAELRQFFCQHTEDSFVPHFESGYYVGNRRYQHSYSSLLGIIINWQPKYLNADVNADIPLGNADILSLQSDTQIVFHLSVPGKPLNAMGANNGIKLCRFLLENYSFSCSRIDCKVRDYSKQITFLLLDSAISNGDIIGADCYTKFTSGSSRENFKKKWSSAQSNNIKEGETRTFGSPQSDKRITFYDAQPVHNVDALDIEVRFRKKLAKSAFQEILGTSEQNYYPTESLRVVQRIVSGAIDFRHKIEGERNIKRCKRYDFWEQFNSDVGGAIRVSAPKRMIDVVKQMKWIEDKCYRVLGMIKELMGSAYFHRWMEDICRHGKECMSATQQEYVKVYRKLNLHKVKFVSSRKSANTEAPT